MRRTIATFATAVAIATAALSGAAGCDDPYDPDAPAIDPDAPRLRITSPARGTFAGDVGTIQVAGTALDESAVASVTVNGVAAAVAADGSWTATVPVVTGTNLLHAIAKDAQGNTGKETRAVVAGALTDIDGMVASGLTASLSAQTFDAVGRGAAGFVETADLGALVQPMNPVVDAGSNNGQPDCLYAQARIRDVSVGNASVDLVPQPGGLRLDVVLDNVRVPMHLQWAVACLDGSRDVTVSATKLRVRGLLAIRLATGRFDIKLQNPDVQLTGFDVDLGGVPGQIIDLLDLDGRIGPILAWAVERFVTPMVNDALAGLNETKTIDVLGKRLDIAVAPARIEFTLDGAIVELDTELRAQGDSASPGYAFTANEVPVMDVTSGFQLAVADDAANQLLSSFWAAKGMDLGLDLATGNYGEIGQLYDRVELSAQVPPHLEATGPGLALTIGDLLGTFKKGDQIATQIAVNARLELQVATNPDGSIRLDVGTPTTYVDILDENVDGANQLSNAQFEAITTFALARVIAFGSGAVGAIPLPAVGGVGVADLSIAPQTGYLVVAGQVR